jgi:hypothetical protein
VIDEGPQLADHDTSETSWVGTGSSSSLLAIAAAAALISDSLRNILDNPNVGLLFVIPGVGDTLRVNGRAKIVTDAELLAPSAVEGKVPKLGVLVEVEEVFMHCSKAFLRSGLWDPDRYVDRAELPSAGEIHRSLDPSFDAEAYDAARAERYARRENFY